MIRKISKTNMNQLDLHGSESWEPLIAVLIRPNRS
jgi:hypothetical protein